MPDCAAHRGVGGRLLQPPVRMAAAGGIRIKQGIPAPERLCTLISRFAATKQPPQLRRYDGLQRLPSRDREGAVAVVRKERIDETNR